MDLAGKILTVSYVNSPENLALKQSEEFLEALSYFYNSTYVMKEADAWGTLNETSGEWKGMIRHLIDGEADLTVPIAADIPIRRTAVDFSFSTVIFEYAALFRKPSFSRSAMALFKPFTKSLWLAALVWVLAMTAIMHALQSRRGSKLMDWILYPAALICLKSSEFCVSTARIELRVMVVTGVIVGFVLNAVYCAILYSFLSLPAHGSWEIASKQYMFGVRDEDMFLFEQKIQSALPSKFLQEYKSRPRVNADSGSVETKHKILDGTLVFLVFKWLADRMITDRFHLHDSCELDVATLPVGKQYLGSMLPKGSPYKAHINYLTIRTKQFGLQNVWNRRDIPTRAGCSLRNRYEPAYLKSVMIAVYAFALGLSVSIVILILERSACSRFEHKHGGKASGTHFLL